MSQPDLSVVIPVTGRAYDLELILEYVREGLDGTGLSHEVVIAVDGDLPERLEEARRISDEHGSARILRFERSFGEGVALQAGLGAARAPLVLTVPAYLQVQAQVLPRLLRAVQDGADLAFASRMPRSDSLFNRLQRWCFNALVRSLVGGRYRDLACGVRVLRREILRDLSVHGAFHRFITVVAIMDGYEVREIDAEPHPKAKRPRPYAPFTYLRRVLDIVNLYFLTKFQHKPLRFFGVIGGVLLVPGVLICGYLSVQKIFAGAALGDRPLFLLGVVLSVLGFQVFAIGLLGEIISFSQATRRKSYAVREVVRKGADIGQAASTGEDSAGTVSAEPRNL